jgi:hypothetical protein
VLMTERCMSLTPHVARSVVLQLFRARFCGPYAPPRRSAMPEPARADSWPARSCAARHWL